ncbi:MAG TPA: PDZ domain-containing protein [Gemmatimonadaceae bacterium]|nr:PDZ domain-containing protein [Gemmatimonadaceae bacterium]
MPELRLEGLAIHRVSTGLSRSTQGSLSPTKEEDGLIGVGVFRRTRMIIDYPHTRIILEPRGRFDLPDTVDASGLSVVAEERPAGAFRVAYVVDGSPGATAGVRSGDEILRVDNQPRSSLTLQQVRDGLAVPGAQRRLTLRRGERTSDAVLGLRMLF